MSQVFSLDFQVRDYELDQFGVVNNAVYLHYLEHTRHEFMTSLGISPAEIARSGRSLTLSEITLRFRASLRSREAFRVVLTVAELRGARTRMRQRILKLPEESLVLEALAEAVFLDARGRPLRVTPEIREKFRPYLEEGGADPSGLTHKGVK